VSLLPVLLSVCLLTPHAEAQTGSVDELKATSQSVEQISDKLNPAVVEIEVQGWELDDSNENPEHAGYLVRDHGIGSGAVLTSDGEIITNHHVIRGAQQIMVRLYGSKKTYIARIIGDDPGDDLALLKIQGSGLPHFTLGTAKPVRQGQVVLAIGSPYGFGHSVTFGVISSPSRELDEDAPTSYIQTDAPINPGNSGGPLVDLDGNMVGINALIYTSSGGSEGIGFAIPVETVSRAVVAMEAYGSVKRPYLGVSLRLVTEPITHGLNLTTGSGLLVDDVDSNGPASGAKIESGDVILSIQGKAITEWKEFQDGLNSLSMGQPLMLVIERNRTTMPISVRPRYESSRHLDLMDYANVTKDTINQVGIVAIDLTAGIHHLFPATRFADGVVVAAKYDGIVYDIDELEVGDILHQVNGHSVHDITDLRSYLGKVTPSEALVFQVERKGHLMYLTVNSQV
jgi:serine protease Do